MSAVSPAVAENNPATGIAFIVIGVLLISVNDMLIKFLSGGYPLHEMVFVRSAIGISFNLVFLHFEGGFSGLRTSTPLLHAGRCFSVVLANMLFFAALASMPLPDATAVFFVGPLFVTLLSIFLLGEKVGARRMLAVAVGFIGVLVMVRPGSDLAAHIAHPAILALPVLAAFFYALFNILTRKLGVSAKASALAIYIQAGFLIVGAAFGLIAGDGRYAEGVENESLQFLLRAWQWPQGNDIWLFLLLGLNGAAVGYSLSRAYKSADAATIAPFEYVALPFAILWGWTIWGDVPGPSTFVGIVLIAGAGLYVFLRERQKKRPVTKLRLRRW